MLNLFLNLLEWLDKSILIYFIAINGFYLLLLLMAAHSVSVYTKTKRLNSGFSLPSHFKKPFSILVPAYNEEKHICDVVESLLGMDYAEFEVVVCNDGSNDRTLDVLKERFDLQKVDIPEDSVEKLDGSFKGIYFSHKDSRLAVIDKINEGKAVALNAATHFSRYPYVCSVDADSILSPESMELLMREFLAVPDTVAAGGIIRVGNGATFEAGRVKHLRLPKRMLVRIQIVEYFRAFLFGRSGLAKMNVLLIISGAFGVFRRDIVERVGGWRKQSVGEDMELVLAILRNQRETGGVGRICFTPYPVCWTQVPQDINLLAQQRDRWQRALTQCLLRHKRILFNPAYGRLGFIGYPYYLFFELLGAVIEALGYPFVIITFIIGTINLPFVLLFFTVATLWGMCISLISLLLAEVGYSRYEDKNAVRDLILAAFFENFGYRQLHAFWRVRGMMRFLIKGGTEWGAVERFNFNGDEE